MKRHIEISILAFLILASIFFLVNFLNIPSYEEPNPASNIEESKTEEIVEVPKNNSTKLLKIQVKNGDSIGNILGRNSIENKDIFSSISSLNKIYKTRSLKQGNIVEIFFTESETINSNKKKRFLQKIRINISDELYYESKRNEYGIFKARKHSEKLFARLQFKTGTIKNSLYQDALDLGIPVATIIEFIRFYSFDVDFQRDVRKGDKFTILYKSFYNNNGNFVKHSDIIFANFTIAKKALNNYKYTTTKGSTLYFNERGASLKKALMRTPINGARLSSSFGYRKHPVLGYTKLHTGIDFAAPRGTPIFAAGNGTIIFKGWKGGYGKYIKIKHNRTYKTAYAHMSRFSRSLKVGSKVKQRQVIGFVGTTGRSTGNHLHYELYKNNRAINPRSLRPESKVQLKNTELQKFLKHKNRIDFLLKSFS